jgi:hypothetical protein
VLLDRKRTPHTWNHVQADLWRRLERDLQPSLDRLSVLETEANLAQGELAKQASLLDHLRRDLLQSHENLDEARDQLDELREYSVALERDLLDAGRELEDVERRLADEREKAEAFSSRLYLIESSTGYRLVQKTARSPLGKPIALLLKGLRGVFSALRRMTGRRASGVSVSTIGSRATLEQPVAPGHLRVTAGAGSADRVGTEVWLLAVERPEAKHPYDLEHAMTNGDVEVRDGLRTPSGRALVLSGGAYAELPVDVGDEVVLLRQPWGGIAGLQWQDTAVDVNLHGPDGRVRCTIGESDISAEIETDRDRRPQKPHRYWPSPRSVSPSSPGCPRTASSPARFR